MKIKESVIFIITAIILLMIFYSIDKYTPIKINLLGVIIGIIIVIVALLIKEPLKRLFL